MKGLSEMIPAALAPSTLSNYADRFEKWVHYATVVRNPPVPYLTPLNYLENPESRVRLEDVHLWLGFMREEDRVHPRNFPQYVSALNTIHIMCHVTPL